MFGAAGSTATNEGTITGNKENSVGMAGDASTVTNKNIITLEDKASTGILKNNSNLTNDDDGKIELKKEKSVGIYSDSNIGTVINKGTITAIGTASAGISVKLEDTIGNKKCCSNKYRENNNQRYKISRYVRSDGYSNYSSKF